MRIVDSLRQEHMPDMVYTLCKFIANKKMNRDEIVHYITLNDADRNDKSRENFNRVYSFTKECGFIYEEPDGTAVSNIEKRDLENFRKFRYRIFLNVMTDLNTNFTGITKWLIEQEKSVFSIKRPMDFIAEIPMEYSIPVDYARGYYFWIEALGLASIYDSQSRKIYFSINEILGDWLSFERPFKKGEKLLFKDFVDRLLKDCPIFEQAFRNNKVNFALSSAFRVLHESNRIKLIYTKDSGDIWNFYESSAYQFSNQITEIEVK